MRVEFAPLEEAKDFAGFNGTNNRAKANDCGTITRKPLETMRIMK